MDAKLLGQIVTIEEVIEYYEKYIKNPGMKKDYIIPGFWLFEARSTTSFILRWRVSSFLAKFIQLIYIF